MYSFISQVDITCITPGVGWQYYRDHLPKLGIPTEGKCVITPQIEAMKKRRDGQPLSKGDKVPLTLPVEETITLNESICGWSDEMKKVSAVVSVQASNALFVCLFACNFQESLIFSARMAFAIIALKANKREKRGK